MSAECEICGDHVIDCICDYYGGSPKFPQCNEQVLCLKKFMDNSGWTDPKYHLDEGFFNAFGEFIWKGGGEVIKWMKLPTIE